MADTRRAIREWALTVGTKHPTTFLVAVSGGGDSLALAWAASTELPKAGIAVGAVIVDHQLQEDSGEQATRAAHQATELGLSPVVIKTVRPSGSSGPEDAARHARYQAFTEVVHETGATGILLGHTEDDQAETVLMGLARGSGPGSLKGMALADGFVHRPLLGLSRATLRQALRDAGITWWEDPHNEDPRFTRVRVRLDVMPVLADALGPGISQALARTAELFRQDSSALDQSAASLAAAHMVRHSPTHCSISVGALADEPEAIVVRVLRSLVLAVGGTTASYSQTKAIQALLTHWSGQAAVSVTGASLERLGAEIHARGSA